MGSGPRREPGPSLRSLLGCRGHPACPTLLQLLRQHPLIGALELLLPLCALDPSGLLSPPETPPYYYTASLSADQLRAPGFVDAYLRQGEGGDDADDAAGRPRLYAVAPAGRAADGAAAAALPGGDVHLNVDRAALPSLGLAARLGRPPGGCSRAAAPPPRAHAVARAAPPAAAAAWPAGGAARGTLVARCGADGAPAPVAFPPSARAAPRALRLATRTLAGLALPPVDRLFGGGGCGCGGGGGGGGGGEAGGGCGCGCGCGAAAAVAAASDRPLLSALHEWVGATAACGGGGGGADTGAGWRAAAEDGEAAGFGWAPGGGGGGDGEPGWATAHRWVGLVCPEQAARCAEAAHAAVAAAAHARGGQGQPPGGGGPGAPPWAALSLWGVPGAPVAWAADGRALGGARRTAAAGGEQPPHLRHPHPPPPRPRGLGRAEHAVLLLLPRGRWLLMTAEEPEAL